MRLILAALLLSIVFSYDFTKPENGNELLATLKDEEGVWIVFFHAIDYEGDLAETVKNMKDQVTKECKALELGEEDYNYIDVEIEIADGAEAEPLFGTFLQTLGFEEEAPADDAAADEEGADDAAAEEGAEEGAAEEGAEEPAARRRNLQEEEAAAEEGAEEGAAEEGAAEEGAEEEDAAAEEEAPVSLAKLEAAPYALVMKSGNGSRVSGNDIAGELCYQAKQFKDQDS